ncbi:hypothetical protein WICMUC_000103 [Wickerhamomyces mucosus]|uniref:glycogenin glucosyltransferase n=1 Tax=Wickerhamomyces mucosus TaxID=1378264 RepID=A0A9P8Q0B9_9ASCO|nr:hypothetical protein WICMUC_000103 [Wickerhamomyces mucosus]
MTKAIATLLFSAGYLAGALVLAKTLRQHRIPQDVRLIVLITVQLTPYQQSLINEAFDEVIEISNIYASPSSKEIKLLNRPELYPTFSKINLFKLTQFENVLFLDSDTLPLKPIFDIFDNDISENQIVACPDSGWPDIFNSGLFLIKPSIVVFDQLITKIGSSNSPSFDGADQGLLNEFFQFDHPNEKSWIKLPFLYNVTPSIHYQYQPAYQFFQNDIKVIHFIGDIKPWNKPGFFGNLRDEWWIKYSEFFDREFNIEKSINGIEPVYHQPSLSKESENLSLAENLEKTQTSSCRSPQDETTHSVRNVEHQDVLLNPVSFQYFPTIDSKFKWDPALNEPPKNGRPEAEHFPKDLNQYKDWNERALQEAKLDYNKNDQLDNYGVQNEEQSQEEWKPPPIFPWEYEHRQAQPTRVFNNFSNTFSFDHLWENLPIIKKIKSKKEEHERRKSKEEEERLKEIERRYTGDIENTDADTIPVTDFVNNEAFSHREELTANPKHQRNDLLNDSEGFDFVKHESQNEKPEFFVSSTSISTAFEVIEDLKDELEADLE